MCEKSFSKVKNVFSEHRRSMLHRRKARLIQLASEKDLTHKFTSEWKDMLTRRFSSEKRRLPLRTGREDSADSTQSKLPCVCVYVRVCVSNGNAYPAVNCFYT